MTLFLKPLRGCSTLHERVLHRRIGTTSSPFANSHRKGDALRAQRASAGERVPQSGVIQVKGDFGAGSSQ